MGFEASVKLITLCGRQPANSGVEESGRPRLSWEQEIRGFKSRLRYGDHEVKIFYVYLHNRTNSLDDNVVKVKAKSKKEVRENFEYDRSRFSFGEAYTPAEFRKVDSFWWSLLKKQEAELLA